MRNILLLSYHINNYFRLLCCLFKDAVSNVDESKWKDA